MAEHIIVLVHGTWGRGIFPLWRQPMADWCKEDSALRSAIASCVGAGCHFVVFSWSGSNSVEDRLQAADALANQLEELRSKNPSVPIHVIAHSHGGNVTAYAMNLLSWGLDSVVFLSTPFLHVKKRDLGILFYVLLAAGMSFATFFAAILWLGWETSRMLAAFAAASAVFAVVLWIENAIEKLALSYIDRLRLPDDDIRNNVLILRGAGDEASGILGTAHFLSSLLTRLARSFYKPMPKYIAGDSSAKTLFGKRLPGLVSASRYAAVVVMIVDILLVKIGMPSEVYLPVFVAAVFLGLWPPIVAGVMASLTALTAIVVSLCLLPFGLRFSFGGIAIQVFAEASPPGRWHIVQMEPPTVEHSDLVHSTHSNPVALREICNWFNSKFPQAVE